MAHGARRPVAAGAGFGVGGLAVAWAVFGALAAIVCAGMIATLLPAFGRHPSLAAPLPITAPFADLWAVPGLARSALQSVAVGVTATALSLGLTFAILAAGSGTRWFAWLRRVLSPILSVPHAAVAFALAFLIAPSGWLVRIASPWATGWDRPPDWIAVNDPAGIALIAGLVVKETPFLVLMALAALPRLAPGPALAVGASLGYGRLAAWMHLVAPRLYGLIRLPVFAVLAYALSAVDMALILGPTTPPTLPVQILTWSREALPALQMRAAAGALLQLGLVAGAMLLWLAGERALGALRRRLARGGRRFARDAVARAMVQALGAGFAAIVLAGLCVLALWSAAGFWPFPAPLPHGLSAQAWVRAGPSLAEIFGRSAAIALIASLSALALALICLEAEARVRRLPPAATGMLYLPLVLPELSVLIGLNLLTLLAGLRPSAALVTAAHMIFVFPYVFLSLAGPYRAWDPRYAALGASLGAGPGRVFWRLRLPMLLAPAATALAVGIAVSAGQYLSTVLIGGGRVATLTTEAVALSAGGDRRTIAVYALAQTVLPMLGFAAALAVPSLVWRRRRAMRELAR